jgi:hypothetical protein
MSSSMSSLGKDETHSESLVLIQKFRYPQTSLQQQNEDEQMARLNYMASRVRAVICEWVKEKVDSDITEDSEGLELWWWTGLHKELVR